MAFTEFLSSTIQPQELQQSLTAKKGFTSFRSQLKNAPSYMVALLYLRQHRTCFEEKVSTLFLIHENVCRWARGPRVQKLNPLHGFDTNILKTLKPATEKEENHQESNCLICLCRASVPTSRQGFMLESLKPEEHHHLISMPFQDTQEIIGLLL